MYTCSDAARLFPSQACRLVFLVSQLTNGTPSLDLSVDHQCQLLRTLRMDERVSGRKTKTNYKALKIISDWQTQDKMFFIKLFFQITVQKQSLLLVPLLNQLQLLLTVVPKMNNSSLGVPRITH